MTENLKKKCCTEIRQKLLSKNLIQQRAHITNFQDFLYSQATFQHVAVAAAAIIREVHLHEPKRAFV
jgi:hypothetical protein